MSLVTDRVSIEGMKKMLFLHSNFKQKLFFCFIAHIFLFSCAPQGNGILNNPSKISDVVDQAIKVAPFAYDVAVDTISYNSCISLDVKGSTIHGLRIGASEGFTDPVTGASRAGLKLRTDFLQYVGKNFKPEYPNTIIKPSQIQRILESSDNNKDDFIQIAIRQKSDFVAIPDLISPGGNGTKTTAQVPRDLSVIDKALHIGLLGYNITKNVQFTSAGSVLAEGPRVYNLSDSPDPVILEGTFNLNATTDASLPAAAPVAGFVESYGQAEMYPQNVRDAFNSKKNLLTVTFGGDQNIPDSTVVGAIPVNHINILKRPTLANSQSTDYTKAFGRGFQLTFDAPSGATSPSWVKSQLTRVSEISLDNGSPVGGTSWSCESIVIMRQIEWDNNRMYSTSWIKKDTDVEPSCSPILGTDLTGTNGASRQAQIKRLRRHYSASDWNIGLYLPAAPRSGYTLPSRAAMTKLCLVPTSATNCYLPTTGILDDTTKKTTDVGIQYDTNQDCYLTMQGAGPDDKRSLGRCAQFASICVRTSSNF